MCLSSRVAHVEEKRHTCRGRQAYKRAALKYHPDKVPSEERDEAERKFKQARPDLCDCYVCQCIGRAYSRGGV